MNFLKNFVISGLIICCLSVDVRAMEASPKKILQIQNEASFTMTGRDLAKIYGNLYDRCNLDEVEANYQRMANFYKIDIDVFKGKTFLPREFWEQHPKTILQTLAPELEHSLLPDIVFKHYFTVGCFSSNRLLEPYSSAIEEILRDSVWRKIKMFLKSRGLEPLRLGDFNRSLNFYQPKELTEDEKLLQKMGKFWGRFRQNPLIYYFEPYFIPEGETWKNFEP